MSEDSQPDPAPQVEIVVPVRNEERDLAPSIRRLAGYLRDSFPPAARVTIADNGSTDGTWAASDAEVLAYMDVDLSTDLNALLPLVAPLLSGHSDVAIGTRLARGSRVVRGAKRTR